MLKALLQPMMIFIPLLLGMLIPAAAVLNDAPWQVTRWALGLMIFISGLRLDWRVLKLRREHWRLLAANLLLGVVPWLLLKYFCPQFPEAARTAFFTGITPTATAAPVVVSLLGGRTGFAFTGFVVSTVGISLALVGLLPLVCGQFDCGFLLGVIRTLWWLLALPLLLALLVRRLHPGAAAWPKKLKYVTFSLWSLILFVLAAAAGKYFRMRPELLTAGAVPVAALLAAVLCALDFWIGSRLSGPRYRRECSQLLGQKNNTFAVVLALQFSGPLTALGPMVYIFCHNLWNACQLYRYERRRARRRITTQTSDAANQPGEKI